MAQGASNVAELTRAEHVAAMADYLVDGQRRAKAIGNRGPVRFDGDGKLHRDIVDAYWEHGFYVFEGAVASQEIDELRAGARDMLDRAPVRKGADVDRHGRRALGQDYAVRPYLFVKPLSDPWGGTDALGGRHPSKMAEPVPDSDAPEDVVYLMFGMCQAMPAGLRVYGHPNLLAIAEAINGADFVPYNDAIFVKEPGVGGSVAWHQDGITHWDSPTWDHGSHGFNFQVQLYPSTAANGLWVIPGTHKLGRIDIKGLVAENGGTDRLPMAVPLICQAGDVTIANRQIVHGSFANTSSDQRISITFGFHRRASVLGVQGKLSLKADDLRWQDGPVYDEERIHDRSAVIAVAIDARRQHFPGETQYHYQPFAGFEDDYRFNDESFDRVIRDYNTRDLAI